MHCAAPAVHFGGLPPSGTGTPPRPAPPFVAGAPPLPPSIAEPPAPVSGRSFTLGRASSPHPSAVRAAKNATTASRTQGHRLPTNRSAATREPTVIRVSSEVPRSYNRSCFERRCVSRLYL